MNKIFLIMTLVLLHESIFCFSDDLQDQDNVEQVHVKKTVKQQDVVKKTSVPVLHCSQRKLFINSLDSPVSLFLTDKNNKSFSYIIPAGATRHLDCILEHIKKITCSSRYQEKKIEVPLAKLKDNSVIFLSLDYKLDFFNFIDIRQKNRAINEAKIALRVAQLAIPRNRDQIEKLSEKIYELQDQTIYML